MTDPGTCQSHLTEVAVKPIMRTYMTLQMLKVKPAGTKRFGYMADTWPVFNPFNGSVFASVFTNRTKIRPRIFKMASVPDFILIRLSLFVNIS
jgi:hypothetical protein